MAHVIRPDAYQLVPPEMLGTTLAQTRQYAEQQIGQLLVSGRLRGIRHQVLLGEGELWSVLSEMLEKHEVDLFVVGTHGRTGIRKLVLGSVAEEIFRLAACPVLTVGPKASLDVPEEVNLRHILYATDFTPAAERAAEYALSLAQEHQAHLTMVHVVREAPEFSPSNRILLQSFFCKRLRGLVPDESALWCEPEFVVEFGAPAEEILKLAAATRADLIVLGVRRTASFPGHLPPATAYRVVCQARCPVLTVRR
jgi:nucleotide-binding universal stress UspA family protein